MMVCLAVLGESVLRTENYHVSLDSMRMHDQVTHQFSLLVLQVLCDLTVMLFLDLDFLPCLLGFANGWHVLHN